MMSEQGEFPPGRPHKTRSAQDEVVTGAPIMQPPGNEERSEPQGSSSPIESSEDEENPLSSRSSSDSETAWGRALRDIAPYLDLGWRLAGTAAGPPILGFGIDLWLQTTPWMLLGGCVFGLAGAILQLKRLQGEFSP